MNQSVEALSQEDRAFLKRYRFDEAAFRGLQQRVASGALNKEASILRGQIEPPRKEDIADLPAADSVEGKRLTSLGQAAMRNGELAVVVVAGGMATRFGGGAKAIVEITRGESFISLEVLDGRRAAKKYGRPVPLGIMTSFATGEAIAKHLEARKLLDANVQLFSQSVAMRLTPKGELALGPDGRPSFYAPGHGEFFKAVKTPGPDGKTLLERWPQVKTVFFKNVDNKGATVAGDEFAMILGLHLDRQNDMTAEVVAKAEGDAGGVVARVDGRLRGVEGFRLSGDQRVFTDFSPNNLLFRKEALLRPIELDYHYVEKKVDGQTVVQLEQVTFEASGALIANAPALRFGAVRVPRRRFVPVKEPAHLKTLQTALEGELGREYFD